MRIIASSVFTCLLVFSANAAELSGKWNWYYAAFISPKASSDVILRRGTANVTIKGRALKVQFDESQFPNAKPEFVGSLDRTGKIRGALRGLFPSGDELFSGQLAQLREGGCLSQSMLFQRNLADGAVLMMSRLQLDSASRTTCLYELLVTK
jgi:hypothetical protein